MKPILKGYLRLCRPPNLPTAAADIVAGLAIAGFYENSEAVCDALFLVFSSVFLYAGGVVFNDYFDYELDKVERPERPLPLGVVKPRGAFLFGLLLLLVGQGLALWVSLISGAVAFTLILSILLYDSMAKHHLFFGPLNMGICRGLNLLLGVSIFQEFMPWPYTAVPIFFIFAVTLISRGEVHGNNKGNIVLSGVLYALVILCVIVMHYWYEGFEFWYVLFLGLFALMVYVPLIRAYHKNTPKNIMKAVKAGVLSIILLDAALAVAHTNVVLGLLLVMLLPLSIILAKAFAVT